MILHIIGKGSHWIRAYLSIKQVFYYVRLLLYMCFASNYYSVNRKQCYFVLMLVFYVSNLVKKLKYYVIVFPPLPMQWEDQHEGLTCDQFAQWKTDNDPEAQKAGLAAILKENGIRKSKE